MGFKKNNIWDWSTPTYQKLEYKGPKSKLHPNEEFFLTLVPPGFFNLKTGPWIVGGAAIHWFRGESLDGSDIDIFFASEEQFKEAQKYLTYSKTLSFEIDPHTLQSKYRFNVNCITEKCSIIEKW